MRRAELLFIVIFIFGAISIFSLSYGNNNKKKNTNLETSKQKRVFHRTLISNEIFKNCEQCHVTAGWDKIKADIKFDHRLTGFPLRGRHKKLSCNRCHNRNLNRNKKKLQIRTCSNCHTSPHGATMSDSCQNCHNERSWQPDLLFQAHQKTAFPLTGAHASTPCESCHVSKERGKFKRLPTDCAACHGGRFLVVKEPDHKAMGFSTKCADCHTTISWSPTFFDHDRFWPLEGAHKRVKCNKCHKNGRYKGTPRDCYSCHQKNYIKAGHYQPDFPTNCKLCHSMNSWKDAQFAGHDRYFPISSGAHSGFRCKECHTKSYKSFNCLEPCHGRARTTAQHEGEVAGFVYESRACYKCHPTGVAEDD